MKKLFIIAALLCLVPATRDAEAAPARTITSVAVSTTTARTAASIGAGMPHAMYCTVAVFFVYGDSSVTATTADTPLDAAVVWTDKTVLGQTYVAFITSSGSGTCYIKHDP